MEDLSSEHIFTAKELYELSLDGDEAAIHNTDIQLQHLRAQLIVLLARVESAMAEIARVEHRQKSIISNKAIVFAPIRRMPPEVLGCIFEHCVEPLEPFFPAATTSVINPAKAPLLLTRVCRTWRRIAFGTPTIWTVLDFGRDRKLGTSPNPSTIIPLWLKNSSTLLIDVYLRDNCPDGAMDLLWNDLSRCRKIAIGSQQRKAFAKLAMSRVHLPNLEVLMAAGLNRIQGASISAPNLRSVTFSGVALEFLPITRSLETLNLHQLDTSNSSLLKILRRYPNLRSLELSLVKFVGHWQSWNSKATLPSLSLLKVWSMSQHLTLIIHLLQLINMPSIYEFHINVPTPGYGNFDALTKLAPIISRLEKLALNRFDMLDSKFTAEILINLETLELTGCIHIDGILFSLMYESGGTFLCPRLKHLDLRYLDGKNLAEDMDALVGLIKLRGLAPQRNLELVERDVFHLSALRSIRVEVPSYAAEYVPADELNDMGIVIFVSSQSYKTKTQCLLKSW